MEREQTKQKVGAHKCNEAAAPPVRGPSGPTGCTWGASATARELHRASSYASPAPGGRSLLLGVAGHRRGRMCVCAGPAMGGELTGVNDSGLSLVELGWTEHSGTQQVSWLYSLRVGKCQIGPQSRFRIPWRAVGVTCPAKN